MLRATPEIVEGIGGGRKERNPFAPPLRWLFIRNNFPIILRNVVFGALFLYLFIFPPV